MPLAHRELRIEAPAQIVWDLFSTPEGWNAWFTSGAQFQFIEGEQYHTADGDTGRFLRIDPPRALRFTWEHPKHPRGSAVHLAIDAPAGSPGCTVHLTHGPLPTAELADELTSAWGNVLAALKRCAEGASN